MLIRFDLAMSHALLNPMLLLQMFLGVEQCNQLSVPYVATRLPSCLFVKVAKPLPGFQFFRLVDSVVIEL